MFFFVPLQRIRNDPEMTSKQYIKHLTAADGGIRGKDIPQESCARVIDGLCGVVAKKDAALAERNTVIADQATVIAAKDADIEKLNHLVKQLQRLIYGRSCEKLYPKAPNQLSLDFGGE